MVLAVFTALHPPGGIERISRHMAAILSADAASRGEPCRILSLNDSPGRQTLRAGDTILEFQGLGRSKRRLLSAMLAALPRSRTVFLGHPSLASLGPVLRLRPGMRYWVVTYGIDVWRRLPLAQRLGLRAASRVIALSQYTAQRMVAAQRLAPGRVVVVPPALDPGLLRAAATSPASPAQPGQREDTAVRILTVARLARSERYKGVDMVIEALPAVAKACPSVQYIVVGDGDDRPRLEALARRLGVVDRVSFAGAQHGEHLARWYAAADVFAMPSSGEGFGVVFLEAMAFGKPVIGGAHGGTPEVIEDGVNGFLVRFGDLPALTDRLVRLLADPALRSRLGGAGRRLVSERYTFEQYQARLLASLTSDFAACHWQADSSPDPEMSKGKSSHPSPSGRGRTPACRGAGEGDSLVIRSPH